MLIRNHVVRAMMYAALLLPALTMAGAQSVVANRVATPVEIQTTVSVRGSVSALVARSVDAGRLAADRNLGQMLLMLSPTSEQNADLEALIKEEHTPGSAQYHRWLKPSEIGARFGVSQHDAGEVQQWLVSQGLQVKKVASSRRFVIFQGTVAQVESAFHTQMHQYTLNGRPFIANAQEVRIPAALAQVVRGVVRLNSAPKKPNVMIAGKAAYDRVKQQITSTRGDHAMTAADFSKIYNLTPLYDAGINGTGQTIAIVARSDINTQDVFDFMNLFGIPFGGFDYTINGDDPGDVPGSDVEATLDLTWAAALAPGSVPNIVISESNFADGVDISAATIVDNDLAPVMTTSFSGCEQQMAPVGTDFYYALWAQAAAEGITAIVSAGDGGGAGCDDPGSGLLAQNGFAVNALASTPFNVAVGGTQFNDSADPSKYWSSQNDPATGASVLSYIPEKAWNESSIDTDNVNLYAGGGGASTLWKKPDWQIGAAVPVDGMRDLPDVSLAAAGHDGYVLCFGGSCQAGQFYVVGGTSASAPAFAAIMALVNQQTGSAQGNPNYVLYQLAAQHSEIFHDVKTGDTKVPDTSGTYVVGYPATSGYDLATGLGSFDANQLVTNWSQVQFNGTSTTLHGPANGATFVHGAGVPFKASVTASSGSVAPTGNVAFFTDNPLGLTTPFGIGVGALNASGTVSTSLAAVPGGKHVVTARYGGDATFNASTSGPVTVTVTPEPSDTYFVAGVGGGTVQSAEAQYGESLTMAVLVQGSSTVGHPSGLVSVNEGSNFIGSRALNYGEHEGTQQGSSSVFGLGGFPVGVHALSASYEGDPSFKPSVSPNFKVTVTKAASSFAALRVQGSSLVNAPVPIFGQVVLTSGAQMPITGAVTFTGASGKNTAALGSLTLDQTTGTFAGHVTFPAAGTWVVTAVYSGDDNVTGIRTEAQVTVDSSEPTTMTLSSSAPNTPAGSAVTFTVQVSSTVTLQKPTGTVTFNDGSTVMGTAMLDAYGAATLTTSSLAGGTHSITANYGGDNNFRGSSAGVGQSISDYAVQAVTQSLSITVGRSGAASVAVIPQGGFSQTVTFSCSGLPSGATCSFAPASLTPNGSDIATDTITISTAATGAVQRMTWLGASGVSLAAFLFLLPGMRRRYRVNTLLITGAFLLLGTWGCGGGSSPHTTPPPTNPMVGTYTVTITGTSGNGAAHTSSFSVSIVQ